VGLVFIVHAPHNLTHIVFGYYDPNRVGQAYVTVIATIIVVVALWIAMSYWTLTDWGVRWGGACTMNTRPTWTTAKPR